MFQLPNDMFLKKEDFKSPSEYKNPLMMCMRFRIFLDGDVQLQPTIQWDYIDGGGFKILIPNFEMQDDTLIIVQFY